MGTTREPILVEAPDFLIKCFKKFMIDRHKQTYYQKNNDGYFFYCSRCGKEQQLTREQFKTVKNTGLCLNCYYPSKLHLKPFKKNFCKRELFGWEDENRNQIGYYCVLTENDFFCKQVAYWQDKKLYARYISCFMGGYITYNEESRPNFTKRRTSGYSGLEYSFQWIMEGVETMFEFFMEPRTYKEYLEEESYQYRVDFNQLKSNQRYLIKNNIFNKQQILAIKYFDLKVPEEVFKYRKYIGTCHFNCSAKILNIHYLDYLSKNNIPYSDYVDYLKDLDVLGFKYDKPKDFLNRHEKVGDLIEIKKNLEYENGIHESYTKLKDKTVEKDDYLIKPIETLEEINYVAKVLHNCMSRLYTKAYSKGETDLYCMWKGKKPFIAIEILDGELKQVRTDHNGTPESKDKAIVTNWHRRVYANGTG